MKQYTKRQIEERGYFEVLRGYGYATFARGTRRILFDEHNNLYVYKIRYRGHNAPSPCRLDFLIDKYLERIKRI